MGRKCTLEKATKKRANKAKRQKIKKRTPSFHPTEIKKRRAKIEAAKEMMKL